VLGRPRAAAYGVGRDKVLRAIEILCHEASGSACRSAAPTSAQPPS